MRRLIVTGLVLFAVSLPSATRAQITNVTNDQASPTPGVGHNYIGALNENVNPANGSLSIRLDVPMPGGRGIALPFHFSYNSSGVFQFQFISSKLTTKGGADQGFMEHAGWSYSVPTFNSGVVSIPGHPSGSCPVNTEFVFTDEDGSRHSLPLAIANQSQCSQFGVYPSVYYSANDGVYAAWTQNGAQDAYTVPFSVQDKSGTVYHFAQLGNATGTGNLSWQCLEACSIPDFIEDRNGNKITFSAGAYGIPLTETDTADRSALSISAFGSAADLIATSALTNPYTVDWGTNATYSFTFTANPVFFNDSYCGTLTLAQPAGSFTTVTSIKMPNNEQYTFYYDSTYGLLKEIVYPTGGYVKYTWGISDLADTTYWADSAGNPGACAAQYSSPAILHRYVSFDGSTTALQQDFAYTTNWNPSNPRLWLTKQTIVTTTDFKQPGNPSFQTTYTYSPAQIPTPPDINLALNTYAATQVPQEQTIVYNDWNGGTLKTVSKSWSSLYTLGSQQSTLGGQTNKVAYSYQGLSVMSEKDEYDFGTSGNPGPLLRKTVLTFSAPVANPLGAKIWDRPSSVVVYDGSSNRISETDYSYDQTATSSATATNHDETYFGTTFLAPRGNVTSETKQCFPSCANSVTTFTRDETGQMLTMKDPCGNPSCSDMIGASHTTMYSFNDSYSTCAGAAPPSGNTNAYLTQVTDPLGHITSYCYGYNDGQLRGMTDENLQSTTYAYGDSLGRLTSSTFPDGGGTSYVYTDVLYAPYVTATQLATPDPSITNKTTMDGMGHVTQSQITSVTPAITSTTTYNGFGLAYTVSNPHTSTASPTDGTTTYVYDALGRGTLITEQDGSTISTTYSGNTTTVIDEAAHKRETVRDGLGRLSSVVEDPSTLDYVTSYTYDALDDLLSVIQAGSHSRTFQYDSLGRLTSSSNPEISGAITYSYDANGNVSTKTAPAPNQTGSAQYTAAMTYDSDNRILTKSYTGGSPTAALSFTYDVSSVDSLTGLTYTTGRLVKGSAVLSGGTTSYYLDYDKMGRKAEVWNCVPATCPATWHVSYSYDYAGNVYAYSDSVFASYGQTFDGAGRLTQITSTWPSGSPTTLATVNNFFPPGEIQEMTYGNGLAASNVYNPRLQPCRITFNSSAAVLQACAAATPSGNFIDFAYGYNQNTGPSDNGSVASWTATGKQTFSHNYTYDQVNRISSMTGSGGTCTALNWNYDAWGNRIGQTAPPGGGTCLQPQFTYLSNNQMSGYGYDSAGNLTSQTGATYTYDNENRLVAENTSGVSATYLYDANSRRAQKTVGSNPATYYAYDKDGQVYAWLIPGRGLGYVYMNGQILAQYENSTTYFHHHDHLGSTRLVTEMNQGTQQCMGYYPFGEEDANQCTPHVANNFNDALFTGKERDSESGLDNFMARYDSSSMGRFMSPDPMGGHSEDPQTLNRYAYVANNPLNRTDPTGLDWYLGCATSDHSGCTQLSDKDKTWVQADKNGNATIVTSDSIRNGDNSATVDQSGVHVTTGGNTYQGVYFDNPSSHTTDANGNDVNHNPITLQGDASKGLGGFTFNINGNCGNTCLASGSFQFAGTLDQARAALKGAGSWDYGIGDAVDSTTLGHHPGTEQFRFGAGPSSHFSVPYDHSNDYMLWTIPKYSVPTTGDFHVDATTGSSHFWCANFAIGCGK
jgi:RHS repeat-associated protein